MPSLIWISSFHNILCARKKVDAIAFANVIMKQRYNQKHKAIQMELGLTRNSIFIKTSTVPGLRIRNLFPNHRSFRHQTHRQVGYGQGDEGGLASSVQRLAYSTLIQLRPTRAWRYFGAKIHHGMQDKVRSNESYTVYSTQHFLNSAPQLRFNYHYLTVISSLISVLRGRSSALVLTFVILSSRPSSPWKGHLDPLKVRTQEISGFSPA